MAEPGFDGSRTLTQNPEYVETCNPPVDSAAARQVVRTEYHFDRIPNRSAPWTVRGGSEAPRSVPPRVTFPRGRNWPADVSVDLKLQASFRESAGGLGCGAIGILFGDSFQKLERLVSLLRCDRGRRRIGVVQQLFGLTQ